MPTSFYFSTARRVFGFGVSLPPSTAGVACPRFVHADDPWCFRTMLWSSIVSFPPRPMRLVATYMLPAIVSLRFRKA